MPTRPAAQGNSRHGCHVGRTLCSGHAARSNPTIRRSNPPFPNRCHAITDTSRPRPLTFSLIGHHVDLLTGSGSERMRASASSPFRRKNEPDSPMTVTGAMRASIQIVECVIMMRQLPGGQGWLRPLGRNLGRSCRLPEALHNQARCKLIQINECRPHTVNLCHHVYR